MNVSTRKCLKVFIKHKVDPANFTLSKVIREKDAIVESTEEHSGRLAHIIFYLLIPSNWIRYIAFRDYLKANYVVKSQNQSKKRQLSEKEWKDRNEYNLAKDNFIKTAESMAIKW